MKWTPPPDMKWEPYKKLTPTRQKRLSKYARELLQARFEGMEEPVYDREEIWK